MSTQKHKEKQHQQQATIIPTDPGVCVRRRGRVRADLSHPHPKLQLLQNVP